MESKTPYERIIEAGVKFFDDDDGWTIVRRFSNGQSFLIQTAVSKTTGEKIKPISLGYNKNHVIRRSDLCHSDAMNDEAGFI